MCDVGMNFRKLHDNSGEIGNERNFGCLPDTAGCIYLKGKVLHILKSVQNLSFA